MKNRRKSFLYAFLISAAVLSGCAKEEIPESEPEKETFFPEYLGKPTFVDGEKEPPKESTEERNTLDPSIFKSVIAGEGREVLASGQCGGMLYWQLSSGGTLTIYGVGDFYEGFSEQSLPVEVKELVIMEGVMDFSADRFPKEYRSVSLPSTMEIIPKQAFSGCEKLEQVSIAEGVRIIDAEAFSGCTNLEDIHLPETLLGINDSAFSGCESLSHIELPEDLTWIGNWAFYHCDRLEEISLPEGMTEINGGVFAYTAIKELTIPENIQCISHNAFQCCTGLTKLSIPGHVEVIGTRAFWGCENVTELTLGEGVKEIGEQAFGSCKSLTEVEIPLSTDWVGNEAFVECKKIEKIDLPYRHRRSFTKWGFPVYDEGLKYHDYSKMDLGIHVEYDVKELPSEDFAVYVKRIYIPEEVSTVDEKAFYNCFSLKLIEIPSHLLPQIENCVIWPEDCRIEVRYREIEE